ncbi:hypothetical protein M9Y10_007121 [Tritrichomonas musculus]|uniref:F5/8 type C domain-containing protein n=1 Tax=Tritrichomonas musculus TaxID=1915356 RepID=A0ABR2J0I2_9EUKA
MSKKAFTISASGLKNIVFNSSDNTTISILNSNNLDEIKLNDDEFLFLVGQYGIKMHRFLAEFISPRVSSLHYSDPTSSILRIDEVDQERINLNIEIDSGILEKLRLITLGESVDINFDDSQKLRIISHFLGNQEIVDKINELFPILPEETNIDDCIQHLQYMQHFQKFNISETIPFGFSYDNDQLVKFISSHFYSIDPEKLYRLPLPILHAILRDDGLKLRSEDSLFEFIEKVFEHKEKYDISEKVLFYELVDFCSLSEVKFNEAIEKIEASEMTSELWRILKKCFFTRRDVVAKTKTEEERKSLNRNRYAITDRHKYTTVEYDSNANNRFNGIIAKLGNGNPASVLDSGIINITSSQAYSSHPSNQFKNVVNFSDTDGCFQSSDTANSWLTVDFKDRKVKPSFYSIRSNSWSGAGYHHPQSWRLDGSNDGESWTRLDSRTNDKSLDGKGYSNTFEVREGKSENEYFQYLRIQQTGTNTAGNNSFIFSALEFFGTIREQ